VVDEGCKRGGLLLLRGVDVHEAAIQGVATLRLATSLHKTSHRP
jgi:hypothetical protein